MWTGGTSKVLMAPLEAERSIPQVLLVFADYTPEPFLGTRRGQQQIRGCFCSRSSQCVGETDNKEQFRHKAVSAITSSLFTVLWHRRMGRRQGVAAEVAFLFGL